MKLSEAFPSTFMKVDDLNKKRIAVTIKDATMETLGDDKKLILHFTDHDKSLVLNKTNSEMIKMLLGSDDTDDWAGQRIILRPDMTTFQGKPTPCIRVDSELPPAKVKAQTQTQANRMPPVPDEFDDSQIPF